MIAKILLEAYDTEGRKTYRPDLKRRGLHPTFPIGRYFSQPLSVQCKTLEEVRTFLRTCRGVSDKEQFGKDEYWQPPEDFEVSHKGDCEDFALWTWRQLLDMGYDARFVCGGFGRFDEGHAWVMFQKNEASFLLEPMYRNVGMKVPQLTTLKYKPRYSIAWKNRQAIFYQHETRSPHLPITRWAALVAEWLGFWTVFWIRMLPRAHRISWRVLYRLWTGKCPLRDERESNHTP